jgi:hypothetical protein
MLMYASKMRLQTQLFEFRVSNFPRPIDPQILFTDLQNSQLRICSLNSDAISVRLRNLSTIQSLPLLLFFRK